MTPIPMNNESLPNGLLLIDKASGPTSHDVVFKLRKFLRTKQVGHAGTLDPLASGLIVALIGEGTKISSFITEGDKGYRVTVRLGATADTQDRMGKISEIADAARPTHDQVLQACTAATGVLNLRVPEYSAVKVDGKKLYEYARAGEVVPEVRREMDFFHVELISYTYPYFEAEVRCSKGSFIRAWASHVGEQLGTGGLVQELRRTFSDPFSLSDAITLEQLTQQMEAGAGLGQAFCPLESALSTWGKLHVSGAAERLILNGQIPHSLNPAIFQLAMAQKLTQGLCLLSESSGNLIAIATPFTGGVGVKISRVFPQNS